MLTFVLASSIADINGVRKGGNKGENNRCEAAQKAAALYKRQLPRKCFASLSFSNSPELKVLKFVLLKAGLRGLCRLSHCRVGAKPHPVMVDRPRLTAYADSGG